MASKVGEFLVPKKNWWARREPYGVPLNQPESEPEHCSLAYDRNTVYRILEDRPGAYGTINNGRQVFIMKVDCVVKCSIEQAMEHIRRRNAREAKAKITAVAG